MTDPNVTIFFITLIIKIIVTIIANCLLKEIDIPGENSVTQGFLAVAKTPVKIFKQKYTII